MRSRPTVGLLVRGSVALLLAWPALDAFSTLVWDQGSERLWFGALFALYFALICHVLGNRLTSPLGLCVAAIVVSIFAFELAIGSNMRRSQSAYWSQMDRQFRHEILRGTVAIQWLPVVALRHEKLIPTLDGQPLLPLTGPANIKTVMCSEGGRPLAVYQADQYGTNSRPLDWTKPISFAFVGDSFTYGNCITSTDHFVGAVRERYGSTINLGFGGAGPLLMLAALREYVVPNEVGTVFWVYDENNDVFQLNPDIRSDLQNEESSSLLVRYALSPDYHQDLLNHQESINSAVTRTSVSYLHYRTQEPLRHALLSSLRLTFTRGVIEDAVGRREARRAFQMELTRPQSADGWQEAAHSVESFRRASLLSKFELIIRRARELAARSSGKLVVVIIPAQPTLCGNEKGPHRARIVAMMKALEIDVVDLEPALLLAAQERGRPALFAEPNCGGHFSELGYRAVSTALFEYIEASRTTSGASPRDTAHPQAR